MNPQAETTNTRKVLLFALALLLQVAIVGGLVAVYTNSANTGKTVFLKIEPVDPRDPLRGDYMTFRYQISDVKNDQLVTPQTGQTVEFEAGDTIYVPLQRSGKVWESYQPVSRTLPGEDDTWYGPGTVFIRGQVEGEQISGVDVVYGIEQFFIPEGTGRSFPALGDTDKEITGRVVVDAQGKGQITDILIDGVPWEPTIESAP